MKIAYLTSQYPAPSHTFIRREIEALRRRGLPIETFSVRPPSSKECVSEADRAERETTWYSFPLRPGRLLASHLAALFTKPLAYLKTFGLALRHRVPGARALVWALFHFVEAIELAGALRNRRIAHLHNHFANSAANVGFLASRFLGIPWSLTLHGISEFDYPAGVLLADKVRAATYVACVSHFGRAQAMRIVEPEHWEKLFIVRCGIEVHALPPVDTSQRPRLRVLCVGRLSPEKGHIGLIQAFSECLARGADAELRIAGDGPDASRIEAAVRNAGLGERCAMLGRLSEPEVLAEMARADLFVSASFMEGLPVVLMEALGMNVAVVAPCVAGIPELVEHHVSGWLFSPGDWAALARTLEEALGDQEKRKRLAHVGRERVLAEFDIERAVEPMAVRLAKLDGRAALRLSGDA